MHVCSVCMCYAPIVHACICTATRSVHSSSVFCDDVQNLPYPTIEWPILVRSGEERIEQRKNSDPHLNEVARAISALFFFSCWVSFRRYSSLVGDHNFLFFYFIECAMCYFLPLIYTCIDWHGFVVSQKSKKKNRKEDGQREKVETKTTKRTKSGKNQQKTKKKRKEEIKINSQTKSWLNDVYCTAYSVHVTRRF